MIHLMSPLPDSWSYAIQTTWPPPSPGLPLASPAPCPLSIALGAMTLEAAALGVGSWSPGATGRLGWLASGAMNPAQLQNLGHVS